MKGIILAGGAGSQLNVNYNNFENSSFFISYFSPQIMNPINMQFNFLNGFDDLAQILDNIDDTYNQDINYDLIIIEPFETTPIENISIQ